MSPVAAADVSRRLTSSSSSTSTVGRFGVRPGVVTGPSRMTSGGEVVPGVLAIGNSGWSGARRRNMTNPAPRTAARASAKPMRGNALDELVPEVGATVTGAVVGGPVGGGREPWGGGGSVPCGCDGRGCDGGGCDGCGCDGGGCDGGGNCPGGGVCALAEFEATATTKTTDAIASQDRPARFPLSTPAVYGRGTARPEVPEGPRRRIDDGRVKRLRDRRRLSHRSRRACRDRGRGARAVGRCSDRVARARRSEPRTRG